MRETSLVRFAKLWVALCVAVLLGFTYRLYWFAYFWTDDFNNLYWVQRTSGAEMLTHILNPASHFFRPVGMAFYWSLLRCCDLDPMAYHLVAWLLHAINVWLVYCILRRVVESDFAAAIGATLFACQAIFSDIYWSFGTIFELTCTCLFLTGICIYIDRKRTVWRGVLLIVVFVFAVKAKEMAITLPLILTSIEILQPTEPKWRRNPKPILWPVLTLAIMFSTGAWFVIQKTVDMGSTQSSNPYYMHFSVATLLEGYRWYFNFLLGVQQSSVTYLSSALLLGLIIIKYRQRKVMFFAFYVAVTFLPVVFLRNHRQDFFWYLPFLGVAGLAAALIKPLIDLVTARVTQNAGIIIGILIFPLFCREVYFFEKQRSAQYRWYFDIVSKEHRNFVQGLRALSKPTPGQTLFFLSIPTHFDSTVLTSATEVALRRTDVRAELVPRFPDHAPYRLKFENANLVLDSK